MAIEVNSLPSVAIILVNWNGLNYTLECIKSLKSISYSNVQIIVVDNGSDKSNVTALRKMDDIHLIENVKNLGFTGGNNIGIKHALAHDFEFIMLLNNDTEVNKGFLQPLVKEANKHNVGAVQPKILQFDTHDVWSLGGKFNLIFGLPRSIGAGKQNNKNDQRNTSEVDWLTGCCFIAKKAVFEEVGLLDDRYFALCEDVDWSLRVAKKGFSLSAVQEAVIYHHESASDRSRTKTSEGYRSPFRQYLNVRNHLFLVRKYVPMRFKALAFGYYTFRAAAYGSYYLFKGRFKKLKMTWSGYKDGLTMPIT